MCVSHSNRRGGSESGLTSNILSSLSSGAKAACCQAVMRIRNDYLVTGDPKPSTEKYQYFLSVTVCGPGSGHGPHRLLCSVLPGVSVSALQLPGPSAFLLSQGRSWPGARMHGALEPLPMASPNAPHVHTS